MTSLLNPTDQQQQQHTHKLKHSNLTRAETTALKQLKCNSSIILKPADKGGKIVLQHRDNYKFEALRQLNDTNFYKPLSAPIYLQTAALIKHTVKNMLYQGFISKSQHRFLTPPVNPRPRHFYTLPKIHKNNDKWTIPDILPPGRPIVSGCNSESAAVEHFIDFHLQPIATSIPSFIRDSSHFKSLLNNLHINDSDILFTLDVESLYSNIPIQQGLTSVKKALSEHPSKDRPDNYLLTLLEITLLRNDFQFDNKTFLQIKGTAMGKKYAPSFANIFMHYWEQHALSTTHFTSFFWKRYIDDIFGIWQHSQAQLHNFLQHLNSINPNIKVTLTSSSSCIHFLDCTVFKSNNHLATKIYSKPTDSHRLLHFNSFHPRHVFESIVKAQILRFIKLSSHPKDFLASYRTLKSSLLHCGYSRSLIKNCKKWALFTTNCNPSIMVTGCKPCLNSNCKLCLSFARHVPFPTTSTIKCIPFLKTLPARPETASMLYIALAALTFPLSISVKLKTLATFDSRNTNTTYYYTMTQPSLIISINPIITFPCFKYPFSNPSMSSTSVPRNLISFEKKPNYIGFINSKLTLPSVSIQSPISTLLTYL